MFTISYSEKSVKYLEKLNKKDGAMIYKKIESIKNNPLRYIQRLSGVELWKLRVGDFRVIIKLNRQLQEISIVDIGNRKDVYKNL